MNTPSYVESPEERRERYLRLAKAAADTAAKTRSRKFASSTSISLNPGPPWLTRNRRLRSIERF